MSWAASRLGRLPRPWSVRLPARTRVPIWFSAQTPEPLAASPVPPPPATAAEPEKTTASMLWLASADNDTFPKVETALSSNKARTVAMALSPTVPKPSWPIKLRATEMPMEAPTPVPAPPAIDTEREAMVAEILASDSANRLIFCVALAVLLTSKASVEPAMVLIATAPAPLKAKPELPTPMAAEAATEMALMLFLARESSPCLSVIT